MNSLKTVDPFNRSFTSKRSGGSRKSKSSAKSCSSRKSNRQEWDYNGHRVKSSTQKSSIKKKRSSRSISAVTRESKSRHSRTSLSRNSKGAVSAKSIGVSSNRSKTRRSSTFMHSQLGLHPMHSSSQPGIIRRNSHRSKSRKTIMRNDHCKNCT